MIKFFIIPAMVVMSIKFIFIKLIFHHAGSTCQKFSLCTPLGATRDGKSSTREFEFESLFLSLSHKSLSSGFWFSS
jgi:hypothetical protein